MSIFVKGLTVDGNISVSGNTPTIYNPQWSNVKLLLHAEGVNGSQTYTDSSTYARALVGSSAVTVSTTQAFRGSSSFNFTGGVNFYVPIDITNTVNEWERMGTDTHPLTIEYAFYQANGASGGAIIGAPMLTGGAFPWLSFVIKSMNSGLARTTLLYRSSEVAVPFLSLPTQDAWHMLAIQVTGSINYNMGVWLDGVWQGNVVCPDTIVNHTFSGGELGNNDNYYDIGRRSGNDQYIGFSDEIRISEEAFLPWGSDYAVNPSAFPDS